ncbi:MAG: hypothetical protein ACP5QT_05705 [Brevinematia bacterium]
MSQKNFKMRIVSIENDFLKSLLEKENFSFFPHQYAFFRAQKDKITLILYKNQTLLLQGEEIFVDKYTDFIRQYLTTDEIEGETLGLDESGKGDIFGPLVLAGVIVKEHKKEIVKAGIDDSKKLSDERIKEIFSSLQNKIIYKARVIEPEEYNRLYEHYKNLNELMTDEYKKLILSFDDDLYKKIILDKYSLSKKQILKLKSGLTRNIEIYPKAERNLVVALASIVARYHFIRWFEVQKIDFLKGSGEEAVKLYKMLKKSLPQEDLSKIAKLHFKLKI